MRDIASSKINDNESNSYIEQLTLTSVRMLLNLMLNHFGESALKSLPIKLIGSTAVHFESVFRKVFNSANLEITSIEQSPIEGLIKFHKYRIKNF